MKKNANYLIELRNATIWWFVVSIILMVGLWFSYTSFAELSVKLEEHNNKKIQSIENIKNLGIVSDKEVPEAETDNMRYKTIINIVQGVEATIWAWTSDEKKNIEIIKKITRKDTSEKDYITWLKNSWDIQSKESLDKLQNDIAEIIPVFAWVLDVPGEENTKHITWKITLKSLINFIQYDIAREYELGHAVWSIGIEGVQFNQGWSDIWAYDIPLKFDKVSNKDVMDLLDFLARTWGIKLQKVQNNQLSIQHILPRTDIKTRQKDETLSQLRNPLITVQSLTVSPTEKDASIEAEDEQEWNISITLTFYIRGVSGDHLITMNNTLIKKLGDTKPWELSNKANQILDACKKQSSCTEENRISDMINIINTAKDTYKNILANDKSSTPIARVKRRSDLMTTVSSIEKKLIEIESRIGKK